MNYPTLFTPLTMSKPQRKRKPYEKLIAFCTASTSTIISLDSQEGGVEQGEAPGILTIVPEL